MGCKNLSKLQIGHYAVSQKFGYGRLSSPSDRRTPEE